MFLKRLKITLNYVLGQYVIDTRSHRKIHFFYKEFYMPLTSSFGFFSGKSSLVPFKQKLQLKKENFFRKLLRKSRQVFGVKYVNSKVHFDKVLKKFAKFYKKKGHKKGPAFFVKDNM